jgi:YbbR domain-containing protein
MDYRNMLEHAIRDPVRKIFAIIFAFGLWIYVAIGNNYTYQREIKVIYTNLPDSLVIVDSISSIDVTFSGRGGALFSIWAAPPKAQCDLREKPIGNIKISPQELRIPMGYGPMSINYNTPAFTVTLDKIAEKQMDVAVPLRGRPKQGYAINDIVVLDTVHMVAPQSMLENLSELMTETLSVRNRSSSFEKELRIDMTSQLVRISKKNVKVVVDIGEAVRKTLTYVPLMLLYSPEQEVQVDRSLLDTLVVEGTPQRIESLTMNNVDVSINVTKLNSGNYNLPAEIILPKYIMMVRSIPQKFNISID